MTTTTAPQGQPSQRPVWQRPPDPRPDAPPFWSTRPASPQVEIPPHVEVGPAPDPQPAPSAPPQPAPYARRIVDSHEIPPQLLELKSWVAWQLVQKPGKAKPDKIPISPITGTTQGWNDPANQADFDQARAFAEHRRLHGLGIVLTPGCGLVGGDLDHCRDPATGELTPLAREIVAEVDTYTEISPGQSGLRFFAFGTFGGHTGNDHQLGIEFYEQGRFLTITGDQLEGTTFAIEERDLTAIGQRYFPKATQSSSTEGTAPPADFRKINLARLRLTPRARHIITTGDCSSYDGDRSVALFAMAKDLVKAGLDDGAVASVLCDPAHGIRDKAASERHGNLASMMQWTIQHTVVKARAEVEEERNAPGVKVGEHPKGNLFTSGKKAPDGAAGTEKISPDDVKNRNDVNDVHMFTPEDGPDLDADVAIIEGAIAACKENPGILFSADFLAAVKSIRRYSQEDWGRLRVEIKRNKPSGVLMSDIDRLTAPDTEGGEETSVADVLVAMVEDHAELFHSKDGACFATLTKGTRKTFRLDTKAFREWVSYLYYSESKEQSGVGKAASDQAIKNAITTLTGIATHDGPERPAYLRAARHGDCYYLDLGREDWSVIQIDTSGWHLVADPPVHFWRSSSLEAMPLPCPGGDLTRLWDYANIPQAERPLVLAWMLESWRPDTPFPVLELVGNHGSAKSTTQAKLRRCLDPNAVDLRAAPKSAEDLFVSAGCNWMASLNNLSHLSGNMQDALCNLATGGGFAARTLFTNADETLLEVKRPVAVNGIVPVVTAQDLSDRVIHIELPPIDRYRPESEIDPAFNEHLPGIVGGLLDLFVGTLRHLPHVQIERPPRMADFARLGAAMFRAKGGTEDEFLRLYEDNRQRSVMRGLDASPVASAIRELVENELRQTNGYIVGPVFDGTMKHLLDKLDGYRQGGEAWPKSPRGLGDILRRQLPALAQVGIRVEISKPGRKGVNVTITTDGKV